MTNTLHRFGAPETQRDDYIVFAMSSKGINDEGAAEKLQTFLRLAMKYAPVNMGHATKGGMYRPSSNLTPLAHWSGPPGAEPEAVVRGIGEPSTVRGGFGGL